MEVTNRNQEREGEMSGGKKKKKTEPDEAMESDDSPTEIQVDVEGFPMTDDDETGMEALAAQLLAESGVDASDLCRALIHQAPVGCVFRPTEGFLDEASEDSVFGFVSVIPLKSDSPSVKKIRDWLKTLTGKFGSGQFKATLEECLRTQSGLIFNERLLGLPHQITLPAFNSLKQDLASSGFEFHFDHFLMILKILRPADDPSNSSPVHFVNPEEEFLSDLCGESMEWAMGRKKVRSGEGEEEAFREFRRIVCFRPDVLDTFIHKLEKAS